MDRKYDAKILLTKYREGTASAQERLLVEQFLLVDMEEGAYLPTAEKLDAATEAVGKAIAAYADRHPGLETVVLPLKPWYRRLANGWAAVAAAVVLAMGLLLFLELRDKNQGERYATADIVPGGNRATLTMADGTVVELSDAQEGIVIGDEDIRYQDGSDVWSKDEKNKDQGSDAQPALNTNYYVLSTPKGGTYAITLPDGSKVWLNAGSTLKYPTRFSEEARVVELEGEAYFEVRRQTTDNRQQTGNSQVSSVSRLVSHLPFRVVTKGQVVEVLGTAFNVSAYADDPETKTTLVEGAVRLSAAGGAGAERRLADHKDGYTMLSPGEQATFSGDSFIKQQVDVEQYTAWRSGLFVFDETPLEEIMRAVSRWYDVEVVFSEASLRRERFVGVIDRFSEVSDVLDMLAVTGNARFEVKGRTIMVSPSTKSK